ncbi:MAG: TRAP transporter small permease [Sphaerochaeta sp.]
MNSCIKKIDKVLSVISILLVGLLAGGVILAVFLRYFFSLSYGWFEEFLTMLFVFINFLGAAICIREKQHIAITVLIDSFPKKVRTVCTIGIQLVIIVVSVFLAIYSSRWIASVGSTLSPSSGIPFGYFYAIVPISSVISIFYALINILGVFLPIEEAVTGYFSDADLLEECAE